jgi:hypothetical protein
MMIVNDESSVVIKWSFKFIDTARGVIYDRHMFIVQATDPKIEEFESRHWHKERKSGRNIRFLKIESAEFDVFKTFSSLSQ